MLSVNFDINQVNNPNISQVDKNKIKITQFDFDNKFNIYNWFNTKYDANTKLQNAWDNPPQKNSDNPMYKYDNSLDFRFCNLIATVGTESDGKLVKV